MVPYDLQTIFTLLCSSEKTGYKESKINIDQLHLIKLNNMEEIRIGVYICWCGTNIANLVDVEKVSKEIQDLPNVVISRNYKYMCSDPGQDLIVQDIKEIGRAHV